jgi:hypothetical protein
MPGRLSVLGIGSMELNNYDERIPAGINPEEFAAVIERLAGTEEASGQKQPSSSRHTCRTAS